MPIQGITTKIISTLGNKDSLVPVMIKDFADSSALTVKSYKEGGIIEGLDRGIDEFGTQAIWIGGIPAFKKLIDLTAYKAAKLNPSVDIRVIADKEYSKWALDNAKGFMSNDKTQTVKSALQDCLKDGGEFAKKLYKGKVIVATALTLATFFALTKAKQKSTKNNVIKKMHIETEKAALQKSNGRSNNDVFVNFEGAKKSASPSFKGLLKNVSDAILFNPVHNMQVIDAGITTERIACSRNKTEFVEHTIKEGGFLFFIYGFGNLIESGINKLSAKFLNKPIDLKIDVLTDNALKEALKSGKITDEVEKFAKHTSNPIQKLDFLVNNPENILVKSAKSAGIVKTVKDSCGNGVIDTSSFIDVNALDTLGKNLKNIEKKFIASGETPEKFLAKTKGLKVASVLANIGISCLFLGYLIPKAVYAYRKHKTGTTKFHVENDIKKSGKCA